MYHSAGRPEWIVPCRGRLVVGLSEFWAVSSVTLFQHRAGFLESAVELQIHQAADQFLEGIMAHARVAVGADGLGPFGEEGDGLVAQGGVARGLAMRDMPLNHWPKTVSLLGAPAAEGLAGRGQTGGGAIAVEDVVLGEIEPEIARGLVLPLEAARQQASRRRS